MADILKHFLLILLTVGFAVPPVALGMWLEGRASWRAGR